MIVIRQDLPTRDWTIFSTKRAERPKDLKIEGKDRKVREEYVKSCPFCKGNESMTPKEIFSIKSEKGWEVRVVPNKFPALVPKEVSGGTENRYIKGPYLNMDGIGSHEVIIESPKHNEDLAVMEVGQLEKVILAYRQRFIELSKNESYHLITIFRNHGVRAGTSLAHPHSQIVATPFVPGYVRNKFYESQRYYDNFGRCVYCDMMNYEIKDKERMIYENDNFIAFAPYASIVPYNVMIIGKKHQANFIEISEEDVKSLASILKVVLEKLYYLLDDPDYNYIIDSSPTDKSGERHYHWHLEILPRLTTRAGFEIGSGVYINSILPEDCAKSLREFKI